MSKAESKFSSFLTAKKEAVEREAPASAPETEARPLRTRPRKPHVKEVPVLLAIPADMLERIDAIVAARPLKMARRAWIMQSLLDAVKDAEAKP